LYYIGIIHVTNVIINIAVYVLCVLSVSLESPSLAKCSCLEGQLVVYRFCFKNLVLAGLPFYYQIWRFKNMSLSRTK